MTTLKIGAAETTTWAWRSGLCTAVAYQFEIMVEPQELSRGIRQLVAPLRTPSAPKPDVPRYEVRRVSQGNLPVTLFHEGQRLCSGRTAADLGGMLTWHINRSVIAASVDRFVLLHSAAAVCGDITVILPADMESGKTTTVAGLLRSGFGYVTDEAVAIDPATGWVQPFPKNLSLDSGSWSLFPECRPVGELLGCLQWHVPAEHLGAHVAHQPVPPPRLVVFPRYETGAETRIVPMSRGDAVQELARMTFDFPRHAGRNLAVLGRVASRATVARLVIGSLDDAVDALERLVSQRILEEL